MVRRVGTDLGETTSTGNRTSFRLGGYRPIDLRSAPRLMPTTLHLRCGNGIAQHRSGGNGPIGQVALMTIANGVQIDADDIVIAPNLCSELFLQVPRAGAFGVELFA